LKNIFLKNYLNLESSQ